MVGSFLDSNTVLYAFSDDETKAAKAEALIAAGGVISVQVLNEVANVARRKMQLAWPEVHAALDVLTALLEVRPLTLATHQAGLGLAERYKLSIYDAMIAAAALEAECTTIFTEDLHNGLLIEGRLAVINPFAI